MARAERDVSVLRMWANSIYSDRFNLDFVNEGSSGVVFRIDDNLAVKFLQEPIGKRLSSKPYHQDILNKEFNIMSELFNAGVNVPIPLGVYHFNTSHGKVPVCLIIIMLQ